MSMRHSAVAEFDAFTRREGQRLGRVLTAHFGTEVGGEVTADALAYAWQHWDRVRVMENRWATSTGWRSRRRGVTGGGDAGSSFLPRRPPRSRCPNRGWTGR